MTAVILTDIAVRRADPIPFFGEHGSVNPVVVTAAASTARAEELGVGLAGSFTLGAGQFCTKPGLVFVPEGGGIPVHAGRVLFGGWPTGVAVTGAASRRTLAGDDLAVQLGRGDRHPALPAADRVPRRAGCPAAARAARGEPVGIPRRVDGVLESGRR